MECSSKNKWRGSDEYTRLDLRIPRNVWSCADSIRGDLSRTLFVNRAIRFTLEVHELLNDERVECITQVNMPMYDDCQWVCTIRLQSGVNIEKFKLDYNKYFGDLID